MSAAETPATVGDVSAHARAWDAACRLFQPGPRESDCPGRTEAVTDGYSLPAGSAAAGRVGRPMTTEPDLRSLETQFESMQQALAASEVLRKHYADLHEFAPSAYLTLSEQGLIAELNRAGASLLGLDRQAALNKPFADLVAPEHTELWSASLARLVKSDSRVSFEIALVRRDGSCFCAQFDGLRLEKAGMPRLVLVVLTDIVARVVVVAQDVTERNRAEEQLRIAATAFEADLGMMVTDASGVIQGVNRAFSELTGYSTEEAVGRTPKLLASGRHDATFYAAMWQEIRRAGSWQGEIWNRHKSGQVSPQWLTISAVPNGDGAVANHYVATLADISAFKATEDQIRHLAFYDDLTQLPNRRLLLDRLQWALAACERSGRLGALLLIDLDNFKELNDTWGHDHGDRLLQLVAQRLNRCIREVDMAARLGGDEFVVMLTDLSEDPGEAIRQAEAVGRKILVSLNQSYQLLGKERHSTPSIGVAFFSRQRKSVDELLKQADLAMYQSKSAGRNRLCFFHASAKA